MDRRQLTERVRAHYTAFASGDPDAYRSAFADDVVWHVPGNNPVSGCYEGPEYFHTMPQRMSPLDEWKMSVRDILTNEKDSAALVTFHLTGSRKGIHVDMDGFHMVRLDEAGRIVEGWGFTSEQLLLDRFFSA